MQELAGLASRQDLSGRATRCLSESEKATLLRERECKREGVRESVCQGDRDWQATRWWWKLQIAIFLRERVCKRECVRESVCDKVSRATKMVMESLATIFACLYHWAPLSLSKDRDYQSAMIVAGDSFTHTLSHILSSSLLLSLTHTCIHCEPERVLLRKHGATWRARDIKMHTYIYAYIYVYIYIYIHSYECKGNRRAKAPEFRYWYLIMGTEIRAKRLCSHCLPLLLSSWHRDSTSRSGATITTDRCLTHIRDAVSQNIRGYPKDAIMSCPGGTVTLIGKERDREGRAAGA